jgi:hypothetical protein
VYNEKYANDLPPHSTCEHSVSVGDVLVNIVIVSPMTVFKQILHILLRAT